MADFRPETNPIPLHADIQIARKIDPQTKEPYWDLKVGNTGLMVAGSDKL